MKVFALTALFALSATTVFADATGSCADARIVGADEAREIYVTEPCGQSHESFQSRYPRSNYFKVYKTYEEAQANCFYPDYVQGVYSWRFRLEGYSCAPANDDNGGDNGGA
jgi:hypothetical protein